MTSVLLGIYYHDRGITVLEKYQMIQIVDHDVDVSMGRMPVESEFNPEATLEPELCTQKTVSTHKLNLFIDLDHLDSVPL